MKQIFTIALLIIATQTYSQTFSELTQAALKAKNEERYSDAISLFNKALNLDKENYHIYNQLALIYNMSDNLDSSMYYCNLTLKKNPSDTEALYYRGHNYLLKNEYQNAVTDFTKSFEATSNSNPDVCYNIGMAYSGLKYFDKAIEYYKLTLTLQPNDKYSYYQLGYSYASLKNPNKDSALKYYTLAIKVDSNYYDPHFNRGLLYAAQFHNLAKAHKDLERSILLRPKNKLSYIYNARLYRDEEELGKAKDMYNKVIELYPEYADAYLERAKVWYDIGILNMVCRDLEKAESLGNKEASELKKKVCK